MSDGPALEQVDYQCLFAGGTSIATTWFGSTEPIEVVAGWYRRTLDGYVEQAPNDWVRRRETGTDLLVVAGAGQWPPGTPAPAGGWDARFRTLVMRSSISSAQTTQPQPHRPRRWLPRFLGRPRG